MLISLLIDFRQERAKRVDIRTMDINKFIVRLEKLMTQLPSDPVKRRSHEQKVVPWINEKDVPRCPECARYDFCESIGIFNAAQPGVGRVQVIGSKKLQKAAEEQFFGHCMTDSA